MIISKIGKMAMNKTLSVFYNRIPCACGTFAPYIIRMKLNAGITTDKLAESKDF